MFHCLCVGVCVFTSHRMCLCSLCLVFFIGSLAHAWKIEYTAIGREEGEVCLRQNGQEWTCKKDSDCDGLQDILRENGKLRTCSWKGRSPILCCPPAKERVRRKSEEKCAEYEKLHCGDNELFVLSSQAKPLASLQRKKREDINQPEIQTTTYQQGSEATLQPGLETTVQPNPETTFEEDPRTTTFEPYPEYVAGGHFSLSGDLPSMISTPSKSSTGEDKMQPNLEIEEPPGIIGGDFTKPAEFPSMALIGYGDANSISWQCGGTLISEHFVLSAAHCVDTPYGLARWVRLGDLDLKSDKDDARPQQLEILERVVHPGYHPPAFYNDVALFRLEHAVVFDHYVKPSCLHTDTRDLTGVGFAAGWGKNETHGPRSSALMQVDISFIPADECKQLVGVIRKYLPSGVNSTTMVCAGELGKDTCQGDSGGPLILPSTPWSSRECLASLVGVTSFGPKNCGMTSVPGAYVRVAHFVPWIESIVWP